MSIYNFNIIGYRRLFYFFSSIILGLSLFVVLAPGWGLKPGIDFTGGSLMEISFNNERPELSAVSEVIPEEFGKVEVTPAGEKGIILRFRAVTEEEHQKLFGVLEKSFEVSKEGEDPQVSLVQNRFTTIGPTIGVELRQKAIWAVIAVLLAIVLYVAWAFRHISRPVPSWQYGLAAILALFHDVIITVGIFAFLGKFFSVQIDTLFITALLTVLGFSVNDTIVVFDRIRENLARSNERFASVVNHSLNETLVRSINTSITTLFVLLFTLFFGGESIRYFVLALSIGVVFGTYSSIFIASPVLVSWFTWRERKRAISMG